MYKKYLNTLKKVSKKTSLFSKSIISKGYKYAKKNPWESGLAVLGLVGGGFVGSAIIGGAIGIAAFGTATGVSWTTVCAAFGVVAGNRLGVGIDKKALNKKIQEQENYFKILKKELNSKKVLRLSTLQEHKDQLFHSLHNARSRICILSGWATSYVIDDEFKFLLAKALKRGVNVFIGYGYKSSFDPIPKSKTQKDAENNLLKLKEWCSEENTDGLLVIAYHPNHSKILICDDSYAVCGSFNWLSNSGKSRNFERSWIVYDKVFVDTEMELIMTANFSRFDRRGFFKKLIPWIKH